MGRAERQPIFGALAGLFGWHKRIGKEAPLIQTLITLLIPVEMLVVNLFVIDKCSEKKFSRLMTYLVMGFFMVVLTGGAYLTLQQMPGFGTGNGLFVFFGFLFVFPVKLLYITPLSMIVTVSCTSWIYTFLLFALSARVAPLLTVFPVDISALLIQTLLYVVTFFWFYRMLTTKFIYMLDNLSQKNKMALLWMSMFMFWTAFILNYSFVYPQVAVLHAVSLISLGICIFISYRYIYQIIASAQTIRTLEKIAYQDELTQLRSRVVLSSDVDELLRRKIPFRLVFMDLNSFKSINDRYGHMVGDHYLAYFAKEMKVRLGNRGGFYRISGDEFVCIYTAANVEWFMEATDTFPDKLPGSDVPFLGLSYGIAYYPQEARTLEELMRIADARMYEMKKQRIKTYKSS